MKYCAYHDVMTGKYDCNYATVVNNSIVCTSKECTHGCDYKRDHFIGISEEEVVKRCKLYSASLYGDTVMKLVVNNLPDEAFPF